jgi:hypothetical protein
MKGLDQHIDGGIGDEAPDETAQCDGCGADVRRSQLTESTWVLEDGEPIGACAGDDVELHCAHCIRLLQGDVRARWVAP